LISITSVTRLLSLYKLEKHTGVTEKSKVALIEFALLSFFTMLKGLLVIFHKRLAKQNKRIALVDDKDINRLLLQFDRILRQANREHINPEIEELTVDDLKPLANLVAKSRAIYLKELYTLSKKCDENDTFPSAEELKRLKVLRTRFLELVEGSKSFEVSIQRGYLDLKL